MNLVSRSEIKKQILATFEIVSFKIKHPPHEPTCFAAVSVDIAFEIARTIYNYPLPSKVPMSVKERRGHLTFPKARSVRSLLYSVISTPLTPKSTSSPFSRSI